MIKFNQARLVVMQHYLLLQVQIHLSVLGSAVGDIAGSGTPMVLIILPEWRGTASILTGIVKMSLWRAGIFTNYVSSVEETVNFAN